MNPLDAWLHEAAEALGVNSAAMQRDLLLDLTRDVAHGVSRPAAPLTAFLVGLSAGKAGGTPADVTDAIRKLATVLASHTPTQP